MHRTLGTHIEGIVQDALDLAFSFVPTLSPRVPFQHERPDIDPDRLRDLRHRFAQEVKPRYRDGYDAGVALAEKASWSQLSALAAHRSRVERVVRSFSEGRDTDLEIVFEETLGDRWGPGWRKDLKHDPVRLRGMSDALRDVYGAVWRDAAESHASEAAATVDVDEEGATHSTADVGAEASEAAPTAPMPAPDPTQAYTHFEEGES